MFQNNLSLKRYKRVRTKYSTQINEEVFDPNDFITEMKPFFDDRERKYKAYTSEQNEIDRRPKPNTEIIKVNNKLHAGLYNTIVDQAMTISQAFQLSGIMILPNNANLYCKKWVQR